MIVLPGVLFEGILVISLIGVYLAFKFGYKPALLEIYRLKLFDYRSQLYTLLREERIDSDHPAYRHVEEHLNTLLQFAHTTNTIHMLATIFIIKMGWYEASRDTSFWDGIKSMPMADELQKDVVAELVCIKMDSFGATIKFLPRYSPAWLIVKGFAIIYLFIREASKGKKPNKNLDAKIISKDYDLGSYNEKRSIHEKLHIA